MEFGKFHYTT